MVVFAMGGAMWKLGGNRSDARQEPLSCAWSIVVLDVSEVSMDLFLTFATQSLMRWIGLFHSAEAGTGALLAIFILFLPYAVFVFAFRDVPWNRVMKRRIKALNEVVEASLSQEKAVARADEIMRDCAFLGKRWKIYESEIVEDDDSSRRYNVLDPHEWFSVGRLVGHGYERWLSTMAGVALTLGLLFTFVGLSAALIRVGSVGSDTEAMKSITSFISIVNLSVFPFIMSIIFDPSSLLINLVRSISFDVNHTSSVIISVPSALTATDSICIFPSRPVVSVILTERDVISNSASVFNSPS